MLRVAESYRGRMWRRPTEVIAKTWGEIMEEQEQGTVYRAAKCGEAADVLE